MKKWIVRIGLVLVALLVVATVTVALCLDGIVKKGVETVGPTITKVDVKLDGADVSPLSGGATLKGLFVGNPPGYTTDCAIKVGAVSVRLKPMSVFGDKVMIDSIILKAPEITVEGGLMDNNLAKIQSNVSGASSGSAPAALSAQSGTKKKIQVADFQITGAILHVKSPLLAGQMVSVALPDIHLTDLGTGSDGVTPAELADKVMRSLMKEVIPAAQKAVSNLGSAAVGMGKDAAKRGQGMLTNAAGGLKSLIGH